MNKIILLAFFLDMMLGDPRRSTHPVVLIGLWITFLEKNLRKIFDTPMGLRIAGIILWIFTVVPTYFMVFFIIRGSYSLSPWLGHGMSIWLMYTTLAVRSLADEAMGIYKELKDKNLQGARKRLSGIVGRDTDNLTQAEVCRAAIETVAENTVDGIISPLFFAFIGGPPLAMAYKAVNTLDSMVGYKNDMYIHMGWCSARIDDLLNYIPARLGGIFMLFSSLIMRLDVIRGIKAVLSDAKKHKSPNSGISEAMTAGVLGVRLGGWSCYFGIPQFRAYMGENLREIQLMDIRTTVILSILTSIVTLMVGQLLLICTSF